MASSKRRKGPTPPRTWEPLGFSHILPSGDIVFGNNLYTVTVTMFDPEAGQDGPLELSIHTHTRNARHDWREFQRIKSELAGPEREGCELYPAESRVVDNANEFHVFVLPTGGVFPFGIDGGRGRSVSDATTPLDPEEVRKAMEALGVSPKVLRKSKQRPLPRS